MAAPRPKHTRTVCSLCGLDWHRHGDKPSAETCVRLLLDEVRSLNAQLAHRPLVQPYAYPVPAYPRPYWPTWYSNTSGNAVAGGSYTQSATASTIPGPQALTIVSSVKQ